MGGIFFTSLFHTDWRQCHCYMRFCQTNGRGKSIITIRHISFIFSILSHAQSNDVFEMLNYLLALFGIVTQTYLYCEFGNSVSTSSDKLGMSIFKCNWMDMTKSNGQIVVFCLQRFGRVSRIIVGSVFYLNLENFKEVSHTRNLSWKRKGCAFLLLFQIMNIAYRLLAVIRNTST